MKKYFFINYVKEKICVDEVIGIDIFVEGNNNKLTAKEESFIIKDREEKKSIFSKDLVKSIVLGRKVSITTKAINLALENDIPIIVLDDLRRVKGRFWSHNISKSFILKSKQYSFFRRVEGLEFARKWIKKKIEYQLQHIERLEKNRDNDEIRKEKQRIRSCLKKIESISLTNEKIRERLMGYEGVSSRNYFSVIERYLPKRWNFTKREHRNSKNPYNIVLNYLFGILYIVCERELVVAGLDPYYGILHSNGVNRKALLYDFIEPFRDVCFQIAFSMFSRKKIALYHFEEVKGKVFISRELRITLAEVLYSKIEKENGVLERVKDEIKLLIEEIEKNDFYD